MVYKLYRFYSIIYQKTHESDTKNKKFIFLTGEENLERQKSMSLDVEEAFPSIRSRIQSYGPVKARATKRILPNAPTEEPKLTIRRVSFEHIVKPENVCLSKKESDDSGCDENFEVCTKVLS